MNCSKLKVQLISISTTGCQLNKCRSMLLLDNMISVPKPFSIGTPFSPISLSFSSPTIEFINKQKRFIRLTSTRFYRSRLYSKLSSGRFSNSNPNNMHHLQVKGVDIGEGLGASPPPPPNNNFVAHIQRFI